MAVRTALLVVPPGGQYLRDDRCQNPIGRHAIPVLRPPMFLAYTAAVLERIGVACTIRDYPAEGRGWPDLAADLKRYDPDLVAVNVMASAVESDLRVCTLAKRHNPACLTVAKGAYAKADDRAILGLCPELDGLWRGEVDVGLAELADGRPWSDVAGLTWRCHGEIVRNPDRPLQEDLDQLPFPARHLLNNRLYARFDTGDPATVVWTTRGCPAECTFCTSHQMFGRRLRLRAPERLVDEIEVCVNEHGIRDFFFTADTFTWRRDWVVAVCREILRRGLRIRWACNARVDRLDDARLRWMKRAGCSVISLGIESGCQAILDRYRKGITLDQAREAVAACRRHGIMPYAFVILGGPWETEETVRETVRFILDLDPDFAEFAILKVHPGTALYDDLASRGRLGPRHGLAHYDWSGGMTLERALELRRWAVLRFNVRPLYVARALWRGLRQGQALTYLWFGAQHLIRLARPSTWEAPDGD